MTESLWPDLLSATQPRGMRRMLHDMVGDIERQTKDAIKFYVDMVGMSPTFAPGVESLRYNCYLRVVRTNYSHLLFQVETPFPGPWPARVATPEDGPSPPVEDEAGLRDAIRKILVRDRTKEVLTILLDMAR